jgi:nitronate monooxygenase
VIGYAVYDAYSAYGATKEVLMKETRSFSLGLHTPVCDLLGVRYPVIQAPMAGGWTTPELVSAVCEAGGFGVLAGARITPEKLREDIRAVKARTNKPFGVNFLLAPPEEGNRDTASVQRYLDRFRERLGLPAGEASFVLPPARLAESVEVVFEEGVAVLSTAMGDAGEIVERAHGEGMIAMTMVTTVEEAILAAERGADVVVAQGAEAGGHRATFSVGPGEEAPLVGTMALVPQVVDAVGVPVVAAGGIADGRGLVAALALGASGAQIGTRFLLARESGAHSSYRRRLLSASETGTVVTRVFTGRPARALRNRFVEEYAGSEPLAWPLQGVAAGDIYAASQARDDGDYSPLFAGQGLRMLDKEQGADEIVEEIVTRASDLLAAASATERNK